MWTEHQRSESNCSNWLGFLATSLPPHMMDRVKKVVFDYISKAEQYAQSGLHASIMMHVGAPGFSPKNAPNSWNRHKNKEAHRSFCALSARYCCRQQRRVTSVKALRRATRNSQKSLKPRNWYRPFSELHAVLFEALLGNISLYGSYSFAYAYISRVCVDARNSENSLFLMGIGVFHTFRHYRTWNKALGYFSQRIPFQVRQCTVRSNPSPNTLTTSFRAPQ